MSSPAHNPAIPAVTLAALLCLQSAWAGPNPAPAAPPAAEDPTAEALAESMAEVLNRPEYTWRLPREGPLGEGEGHILRTFWRNAGAFVTQALQALGRLVRTVLRWIRRMFRTSPPGPPASNWEIGVQFLLFALLALSLSILAVLLRRLWLRRHARAPVRPAAVPGVPDVLDENTAAEDYPWDEWLRLARRLAAEGNLRAALRAMFLGCLARLGHEGVLTLARHKSNRDYLREFERKTRDRAGATEAFTQNVRALEAVWYGTHQATHSLLQAFEERQTRIFGSALPASGPAREEGDRP